MFKKMLSMTLATVLILGLAVPALAVGPTFNDVPETYWGYADIEAVAEAGLMNGTGNGAFSPEMKVSAAQFLTLLGRLVFPETTVGANDTWFGPYVAAAQSAGLLTGTQVNVSDVEAEISRYDMAVILRAAAKKLGVAEKSAQPSEVSDYLDIPTRYADAVLAVYGMGLIRGDQAGNFNGSNTMMRSEVATVIMRLAKAKPGSGSQGGETEPTAPPEPSATTDPDEQAKAEAEKEAQEAFEASRTGEYVTVNFYGRVTDPVPAGTRVGIFYKDGRLLGETTTNGTLDAGNYALWSMDITMDKADFSWTEKLYYAAVIGRVELSGLLMETPEWVSERPQSINENTLGKPTGFLARLEPVSMDSQ